MKNTFFNEKLKAKKFGKKVYSYVVSSKVESEVQRDAKILEGENFNCTTEIIKEKVFRLYARPMKNPEGVVTTFVHNG